MPEKTGVEEHSPDNIDLSAHSCPFLGSRNKHPCCNATMMYLEVTYYDLQKCQTIWKDCPFYKKETYYREWYRQKEESEKERAQQ